MPHGTSPRTLHCAESSIAKLAPTEQRQRTHVSLNYSLEYPFAQAFTRAFIQEASEDDPHPRGDGAVMPGLQITRFHTFGKSLSGSSTTLISQTRTLAACMCYKFSWSLPFDDDEHNKLYWNHDRCCDKRLTDCCCSTLFVQDRPSSFQCDGSCTRRFLQLSLLLRLYTLSSVSRKIYFYFYVITASYAKSKILQHFRSPREIFKPHVAVPLKKVVDLPSIPLKKVVSRSASSGFS